MAGFKDYEAFATAHRRWVQTSLETHDFKRDSRWTESIAVGSSEFAGGIKNAMGAMARGRTIRRIENAFKLRKTQSAYKAIFDPEN